LSQGIKDILKSNRVIYKMLVRPYRILKAMSKALINHDMNYLLNFISAQAGFERSLGRPVLLTLEPSNSCNLRCPACETGSRILERDSGSVSFDEYRNILDQFDNHLHSVFLYFMGEPFLNKDIYKMISYTVEKGLYVSACTNGELLDPEKMIDSGISDIQFQISGITEEAHNAYRINGDIQKTLMNIRKAVRYKKQHIDSLRKMKYIPNIGLGLILMKQNEKKIEDFIDLAKDIGVDEYNIIDPCVRDVEQAFKYLPADKKHWVYDPTALEKGELKIKNQPGNYCEWVYSTVTVQVNGDVVPCCRDPHGKHVLGNVFKESIYEIWNNEKYRLLRKKIRKEQSSMELCRLCEGYSSPERP